MERLDKFLCDSGSGTRSQVKLLLKTGRVTVDGRAEKDGSRKIDPQCQEITLDGEVLGGRRRLVVMLNKPAGYVTATEDAEQKTVMELLPRQWAHLDLKPVGRLDKDTEGLLLFTNDGDLLHRFISPKKEVPKIYYARHEGQAGQVLWGGPSEFLSAVRHADVVMTDSFHATVFSILFKKQFYTFQRFKAGAWNNQNSRLENLLGKLAIKGRFVTDGNFDNVPPIDYDKALALLEAERAASLRYLSSSLKD